MDLPKLKVSGTNVVTDAPDSRVVGELHGSATAAEVARRCNDYPDLKKAAERHVEGEVWARFAAAYAAGQLAAQDVQSDAHGGRGTGTFKQPADVAPPAAEAADALLALWKQRFQP